MATSSKFRFRYLVLFTTVPAVIIGALLWLVAGLLPSCSALETGRFTAPDEKFDLIVFSRSCGPDTDANTQLALIPAGDPLPQDTASFLSVGAVLAFDPRWDGFGNIEISLPANAKIYRQDDTVAGIAIVYR